MIYSQAITDTIKVYDTMRVIVPGHITDTVRTVMTNYSSDYWLKDISGYIIGVVGLIVAGLSVYLSYIERKSQYRTKIYNQQVDLYINLIKAMANILLALKKIEQNIDKQPNDILSSLNEYSHHISVINLSEIVIWHKSDAFYNSFKSFRDLFMKFKNNIPENISKNDVDKIINELFVFYHTAWHKGALRLGIPKLTIEISNILL